MSEIQGRSAQPVGRPRDESIDERVYEACRELLLEVGWDSLSVRQVAARAGVSRTSAHLRWSSKAELVLHAILGQLPDLEPFTGTDRAGWIAWVVEGSHQLFARPEVRAALPGLLVAFQEDPGLRTGLWRGFSDPAVGLFADDETRDGTAIPQAILIMAAGAALFSSVIAGEDDTPALRATITQLLSSAAVATASTDD
ncbi:TetR/AcrR family transcriptional regulator [Tomitella biformata]|uniref:TetR/AcrR family transcriptional regulator n=1 Tax=Tomitella biformata TaxID=630403 RepID=UPI000463D0A4|nr:TetR/AcrR family transcriptional regulator [Tomitella biformata]